MQNIYNILNSLKTGQISNSGLDILIKFSVKISLEFLRKRINGYYPKVLKEGLTLGDIAFDSVTSLFIKASNGMMQIENSLCSWEKPIEDEASASYFLHKIVWSRAEQHIYSLLKESDPIFYKLYRSLVHQVKQQGYSRINIFGVTYITESDQVDIVNRIQPDEFEKIPASYLLVKRKELFQNVFSYLKNETEYEAAIPLNALVRKLKTLIANDINLSTKVVQQDYFDLSIDSIIKSSLDSAASKLSHYSKLNRLSSEEVEIFKKALNDIAVDFKDGGLSYRVLDYLKVYFPDLDDEQLNRRYYSILDYLVRVMKTTIMKEYEK